MKSLHENISSSQLKNLKDCRTQVDVLRQRVGLLSGRDRLVMCMYLEHGNSCRQIARLSGVHEANVSRRIKKISERLLSNKYVVCLRHRELFSKDELEVAKEYFIRGKSIKDIARERNVSYYKMRKRINKIRSIIAVVKKIDTDKK